MTDERNNMEFDDIEAMLTPKCEFHASERVKREVVGRARESLTPRRLRFVPWLVAACVAGVVMIFLTPPKHTVEEKREIAKAEMVDAKSVSLCEELPADELAEKPETQKTVATLKAKPKTYGCVEAEPTAEVPVESVPVVTNAENTSLVACSNVENTKVVREAETPVTRPEKLRYTPEEIEQMKQQAREAYMKWLQLEMEIIANDSRSLTQEIEKAINSENKNKKI